MRDRSLYGTCDITTYSIGVDRNGWPSDGGLIGKTIAPGISIIRGRRSSAICCCFRVRSSHGFNRSTALPSTTVGNPEIAVNAAVSDNSAYMLSIGFIMSAVYCGVEPCGAVIRPNTTPQSQ